MMFYLSLLDVLEPRSAFQHLAISVSDSRALAMLLTPEPVLEYKQDLCLVFDIKLNTLIRNVQGSI